MPDISMMFSTVYWLMRYCYLLKTATFNEHFGKYGEITDSVIMKDRHTGNPRGFGFITYADPSVVDKVIIDNHIINGKQVRFFWTWEFELRASDDRSLV